MALVVVDTGPLYAVVDRDDADHERCRAILERSDLQLVVPALAVAEATYLVGSRLGSRVEAKFLEGLGTLDIQAPAPDDWARIGQLVTKYENFPLGGTDASVVALAERLDVDTIVTLDRRHFGAIRPKHRKAFKILP